MMGADIFTVEGLQLVRDGRMILDIATLSWPANGITAVTGPNGAGKSSLLEWVHGMIPAAAGTLHWPGGRPWRHAMLLQRPVLLARTVAANLAYAAKLARVRPLAQDQARHGWEDWAISDWLDYIDLAAQAQQPARLLSGGQQQRLALAMALLQLPDLLILDEPTAGLDPKASHWIENLARDAAARGLAILVASHDMGWLQKLADFHISLEGGKVMATGIMQPGKGWNDA